MGYFYLLLTIGTDIAATWLLKISSGLTRHSILALAMVLYLISKLFFGLTIHRLPLGYSYAIWCGLGTVLACLLSMWKFGEAMSPMAWIGVALIVIGIGCMELSSTNR